MSAKLGRGGISSSGFARCRGRTLFISDAVGGGGNQGLGVSLSGAVIPMSDSESLSHRFSSTKTAVPRTFFLSTGGGGTGVAAPRVAASMSPFLPPPRPPPYWLS